MIKYGLDTEKIYTNNSGFKFKVVKFNNNTDVVVEFDSGYKRSYYAKDIKKGNIKDRLSPSVYGIGIYDYEGNHDIFYTKWHGMIERCYDDKYKARFPTYNNCKVCDEWLYFSNFKKWMIKQDYQDKELDKDILKIGNKLYSPDTCCFVSPLVNTSVISSRNGKRLKGIGKLRNGYIARCSDGKGGRKYLGIFDTELLAEKAYFLFKAKVLKELSVKQNNLIKNGLLRHSYFFESKANNIKETVN